MIERVEYNGLAYAIMPVDDRYTYRIYEADGFVFHSERTFRYSSQATTDARDCIDYTRLTNTIMGRR